jgi:hypothetical protein
MKADWARLVHRLVLGQTGSLGQNGSNWVRLGHRVTLGHWVTGSVGPRLLGHEVTKHVTQSNSGQNYPSA